MPAHNPNCKKYQKYKITENAILIAATENEHCHVAIESKEITIELVSIRSDKKEQFLDAFLRLINVHDVHLLSKLLIS